MQGMILSLPDRRETIQDYKARGGSVAAVLPIHYPRALFRAFDVLPVEVWGPPDADPTLSDPHLQTYVCSIVRNALSFYLSGGMDNAELIVVPHTCDSLQGLCSIMTDFIRPKQPVIPLYLPRGKGDSDARFFADELRSIYRRLGEITGRSPSDEELAACVEREEAADGLLAEISARRAFLPYSQRDLYRLMRSREYLPAERFSTVAREALAQARAEPQQRGIPVILSGIVPEPMSIFETIEKAGAFVAADDLACCGRRIGSRDEDRSGDVFRRMAKGILNRPPDSTRGSSVEERLDHILQLVKTTNAAGVIFYLIKFCEPELFYLPSLAKGLEQAGVRTLTLEIDLNDASEGDAALQLEYFLEGLVWN